MKVGGTHVSNPARHGAPTSRITLTELFTRGTWGTRPADPTFPESNPCGIVLACRNGPEIERERFASIGVLSYAELEIGYV